jgi:hypothetical protein
VQQDEVRGEDVALVAKTPAAVGHVSGDRLDLFGQNARCVVLWRKERRQPPQLVDDSFIVTHVRKDLGLVEHCRDKTVAKLQALAVGLRHPEELALGIGILRLRDWLDTLDPRAGRCRPGMCTRREQAQQAENEQKTDPHAARPL